MFKNHKLRAVVRHEFFTIVKQPSFWISLIAIPLIIAIIVLINMLTDSSKDVDPLKQDLSVAIIDESGLISAETISAFRLQKADGTQRANLEQLVQDGKIDGLIVFPQNLQDSSKYFLYSDNTDDDNGVIVTELGRLVLQQSLLAPLDEELASLAVSGGEASLTSFSNGRLSRQFNEYIVPGAFLVLFYIVLVFSVGYALTSVSEEKENRSIEMVLSYVRPRTLILGKLIGIILVTLTQIAIIAALAAIGYAIARAAGNELSLPFDVRELPIVPVEMLIGFAFLVFGFIFYVALMAMIGAIFPSSKEASGFSTVFFILPAVPFWAMDAILNMPDSIYTQVLTYFPLTSPTTVLIRNAAGSLSMFETILSLVILAAATLLTVMLATKAFRLGTLEYTERIKFLSLLK